VQVLSILQQQIPDLTLLPLWLPSVFSGCFLWHAGPQDFMQVLSILQQHANV
jgi:hypothetical protein